MRTRSRLASRAIVWRHPLLFTSPEIRHLYPDYDPKKPLTQFCGQTFDEKTQRKLKLHLRDTCYNGVSRDALWRFRPAKGFHDDMAISESMRRAEVNWEKFVKDYEADPTSAVAEVSSVEVSYLHEAELAQMTVSWEGPYFLVRPDFTLEDFTGSGDQKEAETPHPLAGQLTPVEPPWVGLFDTPLVTAAFTFIRSEYEGGPEKAATFPAGSRAVADSEPDAGGTGGAA